MKPIINQIHNLLLKKEKSLSVAESCTGGLLSTMLTDLPGSSGFFLCGLITYSNFAKISLLKVPPRVIANKGAVSQEVALLMAKNIRRLARADFGIGITGIAGPGGATPGKPLGTVFIGLASRGKAKCLKFLFYGTRSQIRTQAALKALRLLKRELK